MERSRKYLGELAKRIDKLPVDPTLVGEIESRYFEEQASGPMRVWAMGTGGEFLFGVPKESFSRLNAVYDREITPRLKEGVFLDRQSFFLGHLEEGGDLVLPEDLVGDEEQSADVLGQLRRYADRSERAFVLSAPLKTADGVALGSLYLKRETPEREWYRGTRGPRSSRAWRAPWRCWPSSSSGSCCPPGSTWTGPSAGSGARGSSPSSP